MLWSVNGVWLAIMIDLIGKRPGVALQRGSCDERFDGPETAGDRAAPAM